MPPLVGWLFNGRTNWEGSVSPELGFILGSLWLCYIDVGGGP